VKARAPWRRLPHNLPPFSFVPLLRIYALYSASQPEVSVPTGVRDDILLCVGGGIHETYYVVCKFEKK
jgi:hypothetical protein